MLLDDAIRQRRSHKVFNGTPVADATLTELLGLAVWAPNHKFTEPWRFSVVRGPRLGELADRVLAVPGGKGAKLHDILRQAGAVVLVSYTPSLDDPVRDREDYAACACAMQNLMLGAVARGLGSYWTTSPALVAPELMGFWQLPAGEVWIGAAVIGTPVLDMPAVRHKSLADLTRWL